MSYLGSWKINDSVTFTVVTHAATGALTDADAVPSYRVYEDETSTAILSGNMAKLDDPNTTGHYSARITLSAANGFEKGKSYSIFISAAVGGVTGATVRTFQVQAEVTAASVAPGAITAASFAAGAIDADAISADAVTKIQAGLSTLNAAGVRSAVGLASANLDTQLAAIDDLIDTEVAAIKTVVDAIEVDTQDIQSKIGTPAGSSVSADIADVEGKVDDLESRLGTPSDLGSGATVAANLVDLDTQLGDLPTNAELATALAAADDAILAAIAALNNLSAAQVNAEVAAALADYDAPTKAELDTAIDSLPTATENADALLKRDMSAITGEASRSLLNALRAIRNRVAVVNGTMTVYQEDDSTAAWTATVTTGPGHPISEIEPS